MAEQLALINVRSVLARVPLALLAFAALYCAWYGVRWGIGNTMAETAYYMNLTVKTDKPIVFVGSQRPWTGLSGDGPRNLYDAVRVAASKRSQLGNAEPFPRSAE